MLEVSLRNEVTLIPPSAVYTPSLIASFSSGSVFFIITSNTPLSTSTLAKCQLPCQVKIVTLCMQGQTIRISCCCCRRCLNYYRNKFCWLTVGSDFLQKEVDRKNLNKRTYRGGCTRCLLLLLSFICCRAFKHADFSCVCSVANNEKAKINGFLRP